MLLLIPGMTDSLQRECSESQSVQPGLTGSDKEIRKIPLFHGKRGNAIPPGTAPFGYIVSDNCSAQTSNDLLEFTLCEGAMRLGAHAA